MSKGNTFEDDLLKLIFVATRDVPVDHPASRGSLGPYGAGG